MRFSRTAMREFLASLALVVVLLPPLLLSQQTRSPERKHLASTNVTVIDTTGDPPHRHEGDDRRRPDCVARSKCQGDVVRRRTGERRTRAVGHLDDPELWSTLVSREDKEAIFPLLIVNGVTGVRDMAGSLEQLRLGRAPCDLTVPVTPRPHGSRITQIRELQHKGQDAPCVAGSCHARFRPQERQAAVEFEPLANHVPRVRSNGARIARPG